MTLTGWLCSNCKREVPLDHYATTKCGETSAHPDFVNAVLQSRLGHYAKSVVEVSHGIGCPRRAAIEQTEPYAVDPLDLNAPETGTAWHAHLERGSVDPENTEVQLKGMIDGVEVHGKCDRLRPALGLIEDAKHQTCFAAKYNTGIKPEHHVQVSLYAELCQQSKGWRPTEAIIWYHYSQSGVKAFKPVRAKILPLDETLAAKPFGGKFTVRELLHQAADFFGGTVAWKDLPLAGESQMFGSRDACSYCSVRSICMIEATGAPF